MAVAEEVKEQATGSVDEENDAESHGKLPGVSVLKEKIAKSRSGNAQC